MKAIIIGATSGIGRELAKQMSAEGYIVGITGRRTALLNSLEAELANKCFKSTMDLTNIPESVKELERLLSQMGDVNIVVINSGTGSINPKLPLSDELETVAVNVAGFTAMANIAYHYFSNKNEGHIVGISSIAAIRGGPFAAYNASKAYVSNYLEGLSCRSQSQGKNIFISDIRPGFVDTDMAKGNGMFWKAPVEKAAKQIFNAIRRKRRVAYITKRWQLIWLLLACLPHRLYRSIVAS
jgi:short-subunit dehydrogenase